MIQLKATEIKQITDKIPLSMNDQRSRFIIATLIAGAIIAALSFQAAYSESNSVSNESTSSTEMLQGQSNLSPSEQIAGSSNGSTTDSVQISDNSVSLNIDSDSQAQVKQSDSSVSVRIESNSTSNSSPQSPTPPAPQPSLTINGQEVALPKNGRVNQTIKDENTKTRLRADIDDDGSSSIRISTETNN